MTEKTQVTRNRPRAASWQISKGGVELAITEEDLVRLLDSAADCGRLTIFDERDETGRRVTGVDGGYDDDACITLFVE